VTTVSKRCVHSHPPTHAHMSVSTHRQGKTAKPPHTHTHAPTQMQTVDTASPLLSMQPTSDPQTDRQTDRQKVNSANLPGSVAATHSFVHTHTACQPQLPATNLSVGRSVNKHTYLHCKHTHTSTSTHTHVVRQHAVFCCFWSFVVFGITGRLFKYQHLPSPLLSSLSESVS